MAQSPGGVGVDLQISPVHVGLCDHPERALDELFCQAVRLPAATEPRGGIPQE